MFFNNVSVNDVVNKKWENLVAARTLTIKRDPIFSDSDRFFTIGSCFAEEIRKALTGSGSRCLPEYSSLIFDKDHFIVDTLPEREHMNYYNTFSIRQEFQRALGGISQAPDDYWVIKRRKIVHGKLVASEVDTDVVYQDPYKRLVFADTLDGLIWVRDSVNNCFRRGLLDATVIVITLGMTEVFKSKKTGLVVNQVPVYGGGGGLRETEFYKSSFEDNVANLHVALSELRAVNPNVKVVLTVSPVPLQRTFSKRDIFVNNYASKCALRAVAERICDEFEFVSYFPSFEIVWNIGPPAYERDLLHVKPDVVRHIIGIFRQAFFV
jgi:hypothetical protein